MPAGIVNGFQFIQVKGKEYEIGLRFFIEMAVHIFIKGTPVAKACHIVNMSHAVQYALFLFLRHNLIDISETADKAGNAQIVSNS